MKGRCPFHDEETPSFVWNPSTHSFKCFGCGTAYNIIDHYIGFYKMSYVEAVEKLLQDVKSDYQIFEKGMKTDRQYKYPDRIEADDRSQVEEYMAMRKISAETLDYCDVQSDENNNIVFHYYNENDVLMLVKYRPARKIAKGEVKSWCQAGKDTTNLLFNMNKVDPSQPLLITEGECFRGNTEILTRDGWVRLDKYYHLAGNARNRQVLQVDEFLTGKFVEPEAFIKKSIDGKIASYEATSEKDFGINTLECTPDHNIITIDGASKLTKRKMNDLSKFSKPQSIPQAVISDGKGLSQSPALLSLQIALLSSSAKFDHRMTHTYCRFYQCSSRLYRRVIALLTELKIDYFEVADPEITSIPYVGFIQPDSLLEDLTMSFATNATITQKQRIIKDLLFFEGRFNKNAKNTTFYVANATNKDVLVTLIHLTGMTCDISSYRGYHRIKLSSAIGTGEVDRAYHEYDYSGRVYCVSVPSGMILIRQNGTIFVCGNCDALAVIESGYTNTVSVPLGAGNEKWIDTNWDFLEQFDKIIVWADNDGPGLKMRKNVCSRLGSWRTYYVDVPEEIDGINVKDANEILYNFGKEAVMRLIDDVKDYPIKDVVDLADVPDFDIESAQGLYSGFKELDEHIYKFIMGTLCIVTGVNSSGKSVLINQMCVCEPLNQGYDAFMFSGELSHPQLKNWIELVMTGRENISVKDKHVRKISKETLTPLRNWYRGRVWVYDNEIDYSAESILKKMEELARKKGVKVFTIDNLMMVNLNAGKDDIYQKQKDFVIELVNFAQKFNVLVFLVAHPRKFDSSRRIEKGDIAGSGDMMNLAHYIISTHRYKPHEKKGRKNFKTGEYERGHEPIDHDVVIDLHKNRPTGTQDQEIRLFFDTPSYRFYSNTDELYKRYKWSDDRSPLPTFNPKAIKKPDLIVA